MKNDKEQILKYLSNSFMNNLVHNSLFNNNVMNYQLETIKSYRADTKDEILLILNPKIKKQVDIFNLKLEELVNFIGGHFSHKDYATRDVSNPRWVLLPKLRIADKPAWIEKSNELYDLSKSVLREFKVIKNIFNEEEMVEYEFLNKEKKVEKLFHIEDNLIYFKNKRFAENKEGFNYYKFLKKIILEWKPSETKRKTRKEEKHFRTSRFPSILNAMKSNGIANINLKTNKEIIKITGNYIYFNNF